MGRHNYHPRVVYVYPGRNNNQQHTRGPIGEGARRTENSYDKKNLQEIAKKLQAQHGKIRILKYAGLHFLLVKPEPENKIMCMGEIKEWDGKAHDNIPDAFFEKASVFCMACDSTGDRYYVLENIEQYHACHEIKDRFDLGYFKLKRVNQRIQDAVLGFAHKNISGAEPVIEKNVHIEGRTVNIPHQVHIVVKVDENAKKIFVLGTPVESYFPRIDMPEELLPDAQKGVFGIVTITGYSPDFVRIDTVHQFLSFLSMRDKVNSGSRSFSYYAIKVLKPSEIILAERELSTRNDSYRVIMATDTDPR